MGIHCATCLAALALSSALAQPALAQAVAPAGDALSANAWNVGAYCTDTNAKDAGHTLAGRNIGKATGMAFVHEVFF